MRRGDYALWWYFPSSRKASRVALLASSVSGALAAFAVRLYGVADLFLYSTMVIIGYLGLQLAIRTVADYRELRKLHAMASLPVRLASYFYYSISVLIGLMVVFAPGDAVPLLTVAAIFFVWGLANILYAPFLSAASICLGLKSFAHSEDYSIPILEIFLTAAGDWSILAQWLVLLVTITGYFSRLLRGELFSD